MFKPKIAFVIAVVSLVGVSLPSRAADGTLAAYLAPDVVAVGSVDLTKLNLMAVADEVEKLGVAAEAPLQGARADIDALQQALKELTNRGAKRAYALIRVSDVFAGGTSWLVELDDPSHAAESIELLKAWSAKAHGTPQLGGVSNSLPAEFAAAGNIILGAPTAEALKSLKKSATTAARPDAAAALAALAEADAGFVAFGNADSRRVVREMFPRLPAPFMEIDGKLLADGVSWAGLLFKMPPQATVALTLETSAPAAAATLEQSAAKGLELLKALCLQQLATAPPDQKAQAGALLPLVGLLKPNVADTRLSITIGDDQAEVDAIKSLLIPALASAREAASRAQRMNHFKQIALGMHVYHDAKKSFPPAASYDADGKPLLSWRVHLLPYLEQQALYDEFHLDEPWNSEHNAKLIPRMPAIYADPSLARLAAEGRTTYCVPTGPGMVFDGRDGTQFKGITDGTSNTVLLIEVTPTNAVVWTKPDDWQVDLADPLRGVKRDDGELRGEAFAAAFCDGSCRMIGDNIDPKAFAAMLTRAAGDVVP